MMLDIDRITIWILEFIFCGSVNKGTKHFSTVRKDDSHDL